MGTADTVPEPEVRQLDDGIYAYIQLDGSWGLNNTGFLVDDEGAFVVDTCFTEARTRAFLDAMREATSNPPHTLVNTHHHGDHTFGNYLLPRETTIVGHKLCRDEVIETGLEVRALFPGVEWGDLEVAPPFVTFEEGIEFYVNGLRVEARHLGPAHTSNDIVLSIPERKILFAGDLAFNGGTPFVVMGSVSGSLAAYEKVRAFDAEVVVPGHGAVCDMKVFDDMVDYLQMIQRVAEEAHSSGTPPLEAAREVDLGRFAEWLDGERLVGNLHRALAELRGTPPAAPLDLEPIVGDMIAYNDGQPLRSLA